MYVDSRPFRIFTGSEDFQTAIYNGPPFKLGQLNQPHTNFVNCVRYSPNGQYTISVSSDKKVQLYDGTTGQPTREIPNAHDGGAIFLCDFVIILFSLKLRIFL